VILILFTPLVLGPFGLSFSEYPKTVYFRTLTEIIVILWAILLISDIRYPKSEIRNPKYILQLTPLTAIVLIFFAAITIASLFGFNIMRSLFGSLEIGGGLLTQFHYLAFFLILSGVFRHCKDWTLFFRGAVLVSFFSTIAALLQKFTGIGFYGVSLGAERVSGTLSNPVYFGFFTAMATFLALYLIVTESGKRERFLWGGIILLNTIAILLAGSRAGLFGLLLGIGIIATLWFFFLLPKNSQWRKVALFGTLIVVITASGMLMLATKNRSIYSADSPLLTRWMQLLDLPTMLEGRYPGWETAIRAWRDRPIFGWGEGSFGYLYDKYFDAHFIKHINAYYVFQDAHNKILNLMAQAGLLGAGSYLAIFAVLLVALWKGRERQFALWYRDGEQGITKSTLVGEQSHNQLATFVLIGFFTNHFVQNLFAFDTASTYILFFLTLGFVNNQYFARAHVMVPSLWQFKGAAAILLILWAIANFYFLNVKPSLAGYDFVKGFFQEKNNFAASISFYQKGSSRGTPYDRELRHLFAARLLTALDQNLAQDRKGILEQSVRLKELLKPELTKPEFRYLELYTILSEIDEWLYIETKNISFLHEAEEMMKQAVAFNDQWFRHYYYLGRYAIYQGRYEEGEALFRKGFSLSLGNTDDLGTMYKAIGIAYWRAAVTNNLPELREKAAENFLVAANIIVAQMKRFTPEQKLTIPVATLKNDIAFLQQTVNLLAQLGKTQEAKTLVDQAKEAYGIPK
jgi:O-antigen ligase